MFLVVKGSIDLFVYLDAKHVHVVIRNFVKSMDCVYIFSLAWQRWIQNERKKEQETIKFESTKIIKEPTFWQKFCPHYTKRNSLDLREQIHKMRLAL